MNASKKNLKRIERNLNSAAFLEENDEQNPAYLHSTTATDLLVAIANGLLDPTQLAKNELANRGLDLDGNWVGFAKAKKLSLPSENIGR